MLGQIFETKLCSEFEYLVISFEKTSCNDHLITAYRQQASCSEKLGDKERSSPPFGAKLIEKIFLSSPRAVTGALSREMICYSLDVI